MEEKKIANNNKLLYRDIVLLYCPEKVGSTSLATSIRTCASDKFIVFHSHQEDIFKVKGDKKIITVHYSDIINTEHRLNEKFLFFFNKSRYILIIQKKFY